MVKIQATYQGHKHCLAKHDPSGSELETDAPKDNQGLGEKFSPTDLIATSLGTCILTTVAIVAERDGIDIKGATVEVEKHMIQTPRRVGMLKVNLNFPKTVPEEYRAKIKNVAEACPVRKSIHPDIDIPTEISYIL